MHRPAAVEAAPSREKRRECSHTATLPTIFCCCKDAGILNRKTCRGQSTGAFQTSSYLLQNILNTKQHSIRRGTAPWATGSSAVVEAAFAGTDGILFMLFVCFPLSVVWMSCPRSVRIRGGRHGFSSRLGLLELFVFFSFLP